MNIAEAMLKIETEINSMNKLFDETKKELPENELAVFLRDNIECVIDFIAVPEELKIETFDKMCKKKKMLIIAGALKTLEETKTLLKNIEPVLVQIQNVTEEELFDKTDLLYVTNYLRMI